MTVLNLEESLKTSALRYEADKVRFNIKKFRRYHEKRARFFGRWHVGIIVLVPMGTLVSFLLLILERNGILKSNLPMTFAIVVTMITAVVAFGFSSNVYGKSRLHFKFRAKCIDLEKALLSHNGVPSTQELKNIQEGLIEIHETCPPIRETLYSICHNETVMAMGYDEDQRLEIKWYQRLLANFIDVGYPIRKSTASIYPLIHSPTTKTSACMLRFLHIWLAPPGRSPEN